MFEGLTLDDAAEMVAAVAAAAGRGELPVGDPAAAVVTTARMMDQLAGLHRMWLAEVARTGQTVDRGMLVSRAVWLELKTGAGPTAAKRQVHTAWMLDEVLPRTGELLRAGEIAVDRVDAICQAAGATEVTRQVASADEEALLDIVRPLRTGNLREVLRHWRYTVDPPGAEDAEQRQYERRRLWVSRGFEDSWVISGTLDPVGGAAVAKAIEALSAPAGVDDDRKPKQRRADALVQLARQALDNRDLPDVAGERPHVSVTVDLTTLTGHSTRPADLEHVGAISGRLARQILCDAGIVRVVTAGPSEILDIGRRTRTVGPALRRALNVRDGGCVFARCRRPTSWTEAHHVVHWADGGPTNLDNLALLCSQHHRAIHQLGWTLMWGPDRRWHTHPPADEPLANPWTAGHRRRRRAA